MSSLLVICGEAIFLSSDLRLIIFLELKTPKSQYLNLETSLVNEEIRNSSKEGSQLLNHL